MDPYLECPGLWRDVHNELIGYIREQLNQEISEHYVACLEERVFVCRGDDSLDREYRPDVLVREETAVYGAPVTTDKVEPVEIRTIVDEEMREVFITIRTVADDEVITVIEVLSRGNKRPGSSAHRAYMEKRDDIVGSSTHLAEIDLLRAGASPFPKPEKRAGMYHVHVSRVERRPMGQVWPIRLEQRLPTIPIPLLPGDPDASVDLQQVLDRAYDRAGYHRRVDYEEAPPLPDLPVEQLEWAVRLLRERGARKS